MKNNSINLAFLTVLVISLAFASTPTMNPNTNAIACLDLQDPVIDSPSDITYEEGATGNSITWTANDDHPHKYNVTKDCEVVKSGLWNISGELITVSVDGLSLGTYTFTCSVNDTSGNSASDSVIVVVVDTTSPTFIDRPDDVEYKEGTTGHSITWTATDTNPNMYNITKDGELVKYGLWNTSGEAITIDLDALDLSLGTYVFVCSVNDTYGNSASDEVIVTVTEAEVVPQKVEEEEEFPWLLAGLAVLIALVIILALLFFRPKGEES